MELHHSRPTSSSERRRPVLFLDFGDVVCLNFPCDGYDAQLALTCALEGSGRLDEQPELMDRLFDADAIALLADIDLEFHPRYVLSTRWWWQFSKEEIANVLARCGLGFVWENRHDDWATLTTSRPDVRWLEIKSWLRAHPECVDNWVVLDDHLSGTGLAASQPEERLPFIVLCSEGIGLTEREYLQLRAAFQLRSLEHARSTHDDTK